MVASNERQDQDDREYRVLNQFNRITHFRHGSFRKLGHCLVRIAGLSHRLRLRQIGGSTCRIADLSRDGVLGINHGIRDNRLFDRVGRVRRQPQQVAGTGGQRTGYRGIRQRRGHSRVHAVPEKAQLNGRLGVQLRGNRGVACVASHRLDEARIGRISNRDQARRVGHTTQGTPDVVGLHQVIHANVARRQLRRDALPVKLVEIAGQNRLTTFDGQTFLQNAMPEE